MTKRPASWSLRLAILLAWMMANTGRAQYSIRDGSWDDAGTWQFWVGTNLISRIPAMGDTLSIANHVSNGPNGLFLYGLSLGWNAMANTFGSLEANNLTVQSFSSSYGTAFSGTIAITYTAALGDRTTNNGALVVLPGSSLQLSTYTTTQTGIADGYGSGGIFNSGNVYVFGQGRFNLNYGFYNQGGTVSIGDNQTLALGRSGISTNTTFVTTSGGTVDLAGTGGSQHWTGFMTGTGGGSVLLRTNQMYGDNLLLNFSTNMFWFTGGLLNGAPQASITNAGVVQLLANSVASNAPGFYQTFYNGGLVMQTNSGFVRVVSSSWPIINQTNGTYQFINDGILTNGEFDNYGLLQKIGIGSASMASIFNNYGGTVEVDGGNLVLSGANYLQNTFFSLASGTWCDLTGGGTVTVYGTMSGSGSGVLQLANGVLNSGAAMLTLNFPQNLFWWTGGKMGSGLSYYVITNTGFLELRATNAPQLFTTLYNTGRIRHWGANTMTNSWLLENLVSGTNELVDDGGMAGTGLLDNWGVLLKSGGSGNSTISCPLNNHGGLIDVESGTLVLANTGSSSNGIINTAAGAVCDLTGGISGPTWSGTLTGTGSGLVQVASGTIYCGPGNLSLNFPPGMFWWTGGNLSGNYNWTNLNAVNILPSSGQQLRENFYNQSNLYFLGTNLLVVAYPLENLVGGTIDFLNDGGAASGGISSALNNRGLIRKLGGQGITSINCPFNNYGGTVQVLSGEILLGGGGYWTNGSFSVLPGAVCDVNGGSTPMWSGLISGSGGGAVIINRGGLIASTGGATFNFASNTLQWIAGPLFSPYAGNFTNLGTLNIVTASNTLVATKLYNAGLIHLSGNTNLNLSSYQGTLENLAGATNEITSDAGISGNPIDNWGVLRKSGGTGVSTISSAINQNGLVQVDSGTLALSSSALRTNFNYAVGAGASLDLTGGSTVTFSGNLSASGAGRVYLASGQLYGNNLLLNFPAGMFWFTGGILNGTSGYAITNAGTINIAPVTATSFYQTLYNDGLIALKQNGVATITSASWPIENRSVGTIDFQGDGTLTGGLLDSWGLIRKSSGTGTAALSTTFVNHGGSIRVDSGTLSFAGQSVNLTNGALTISLNGTNAGQWGKLTCGTAALGGPLNVLLPRPLNIVAGTPFRFLSATNRAGTFNPVTVPAGFSVIYDAAGAYLLATNNFTTPPPALLSPLVQASQFNFSFQSYSGLNYFVQHNDNLATTNWITDTNFPGDGSLVPISLPIVAQPSRFYRVLQN